MEEEFDVKRKSNLNKIIVLVAIGLIFVIYIVFAIYIPYKNKDLNKPNNQSETGKKEDPLKKEDDTEVELEEKPREKEEYTYGEYPLDDEEGYITRAKYTGKFNVSEYVFFDYGQLEYEYFATPNSIILPYIDVKKESASVNKMNKEIKDIFDFAVKKYNEFSTDGYALIAYNYTYTKYENIYSLVISRHYNYFVEVVDDNYTYNFSTDGKVYKYNDLLKLVNLSSGEVRDKLSNYILKEYNIDEAYEDEDNFLNRTLKEYDESFKNGTTKAILGLDGTLNLIIQDDIYGDVSNEIIVNIK